MAASDNYECELDDFALEKAKRELNEDPKQRLGAVQSLREWVQQQKHLSLPTDTNYLLRFLRTAKFSQLRAREIIEGNLELRTKFPYWYVDLDTHDPDQMFPIRRGMMIPLPGRDKEGRKVVLTRQGLLNKKELEMISKNKEKRHKMFKGFFILFSHMMKDENTQVHGFLELYDFTNYTMQHFGAFPMSEMQDMMQFQGRIAGRLKGFYYYNVPTFFETVFALFRPLMKKKMTDRIKILGSNLENVYEHVPKEMLPVEYLPDDYTGPNAGTLDEMAAKLCKELEQNDVREQIRYETSPQWKIDLKKKEDVPAASFRKLNID